MGLPRAMRCHQLGNYDEAERHYKRALEQDPNISEIYQNYGALLKTTGKLDEALGIYLKGIELFPEHTGILRNYANALRQDSPVHSVDIYFTIIQICCRQSDFISDKIFQATCDDIIDFLYKEGLYSWALSLINSLLPYANQFSCQIYRYLLLLSDRLDIFDDRQKQLVEVYTRELAANNSILDVSLIDFALAFHKLTGRRFNEAYSLYEDTIQRIDSTDKIDVTIQEKLQQLIDCNSWNFSCACLPLGKFDPGWKLFEYGLRTPADGKQKWQRSLPKVFTSKELSIWRGENGSQKRILLLEEQAIGDVMMFLTLLSRLIDEFAFVGIYISERLVSIYKRSFADSISLGKVKFYTKSDFESSNLISRDFDFQSPIGSICQHRFISFANFEACEPQLIPDLQLSNKLRSEYINYRAKKQFLVGISWTGGGRGPRIKEKSIDPVQFLSLLTGYDSIRFVNLQYGNSSPQIHQWQSSGLDVIHDKRINPLKDMDSWLAQVQACDAVLSVANTTIHGAGGLNIPTLCLLSIYSDWRWLSDARVTRSYWYPSVGIARQSVDKSWVSAFALVKTWLHDGCPLPSGPIC